MAETVEYNLNLDLTLHPIQSILIKQYSKNVYKLIVSVTKETVVYVLNDSLYNVYFKMRTPDNRYVYTQGSIDENGRILLDVPESAAWTAGIGEAEFEIIKKDGTSRMSTCSFEVVIDASSYEEAEITGSEDFSALVDLLGQSDKLEGFVNQAKSYSESATTSANQAENYKNQAETIVNQTFSDKFKIITTPMYTIVAGGSQAGTNTPSVATFNLSDYVIMSVLIIADNKTFSRHSELVAQCTVDTATNRYHYMLENNSNEEKEMGCKMIFMKIN